MNILPFFVCIFFEHQQLSFPSEKSHFIKRRVFLHPLQTRRPHKGVKRNQTSPIPAFISFPRKKKKKNPEEEGGESEVPSLRTEAHQKEISLKKKRRANRRRK